MNEWITIQTVNFIRAKGQNHQQVEALFSWHSVILGLPITSAGWAKEQSQIRLWIEQAKFMEKKSTVVAKLDDPQWLADLVF